MKSHPLRQLVRQVVSGEVDEDSLLVNAEAVSQAGHPKWNDVSGQAAFYGAGIAGAYEGLKDRLSKKDVPPPKGTVQSGLQTQTTLADRFKQAGAKTSSFLAIAGITSPDNDDLDTLIDGVVAKAIANRDAIDAGTAKQTFPNLDDIEKMASKLIGINKGDDEILQVRCAMNTVDGRDKDFQVHAFDKRGYHVLWAQCRNAGDGALAVASLRASHGRNCDSFELAPGKMKVPGRGNAGLTAEALEAVIKQAVDSGVKEIRTSPGSPAVARLYAKMGFKFMDQKDGYSRQPVQWALETIPLYRRLDDARRVVNKVTDMDTNAHESKFEMVLDLTDRAAVRQALVAFQLSRSAIEDVPKGVREKIQAMGQELVEPAFLDWATKPELHNERIVGSDPPI